MLAINNKKISKLYIGGKEVTSMYIAGQRIYSSFKVKPFGECTDAELKKCLEMHYNGEIDLTEFWHIGDTRKIHLNGIASPSTNAYTDPWPEQDITIVITEMNYHDLETPINGKTKAIITCQVREAVNNLTADISVQGTVAFSTMPFSLAGWDFMNWMDNDFYNTAIPVGLRPLIKPIKHMLFDSREALKEQEFIQKVFLPSAAEVEKDPQMYNSSHSALIPWRYFTDNSSHKIKYGNNNGKSNNVAVEWLTLMPGYFLPFLGSMLYTVTATGELDYDGGQKNVGYAFTPAFCL